MGVFALVEEADVGPAAVDDDGWPGAGAGASTSFPMDGWCSCFTAGEECCGGCDCCGSSGGCCCCC